MIKVYIGELLPDTPHTEVLFPNLGNRERQNPFNESVFEGFTTPIVEIVKEPASADYFLLPHNYNLLKNHRDYVSTFSALAEEHGKKMIVFNPGDSDEEIPILNSVIFRNSQYGYKKQDNEIIMPGFAVDLGKKYGLLLRKKDDKPIVGFCGWASYTKPREWVSYAMHNLMETLVGNLVFKKGLYFRRRSLAILRQTDKVRKNFVIRASYSGNEKTITLDPRVARKEYVDNIKNSDFTLAPKGDGNFSVRFFESLSLGRVPLLIDTDCVLPLEDEIRYDEFILRVDYNDMLDLPSIITEYYDALSPEAYLERQKRCREIFEKYLRIDVFFKITMTPEFLL